MANHHSHAAYAAHPETIQRRNSSGQHSDRILDRPVFLLVSAIATGARKRVKIIGDKTMENSI